MNEHDITEQAYKNGYEAGKRDARKHGRWAKQVEDGMYWYECSVCGGEIPRTRHGYYMFSDFCPNCGADMRLSAVFDETLSAIKNPEYYQGGTRCINHRSR